jgi:hypothetical protein
MEPNKNCSCPENHEGHICLLRVMGMTQTIEFATDNPTVKCFTCGEKANSVVEVCVQR